MKKLYPDTKHCRYFTNCNRVGMLKSNSLTDWFTSYDYIQMFYYDGNKYRHAAFYAMEHCMIPHFVCHDKWSIDGDLFVIYLDFLHNLVYCDRRYIA